MTAGPPGPPAPKRLHVLVDGARMPDDEAHALWERFSDWMEEHRGDLGGFAAREGFASIHPGVEGDRPVLLASRSQASAQRAYAPALDASATAPSARGRKRRR